MFWTSCIDEKDIEDNPGNGQASMSVSNTPLQDYHDLVNALLLGSSVPGVASFNIEWTKSRDKHNFHYEPESWDANVVFNSAQAWWEAETDDFKFVTDSADTSFSLFAEVGHERNGVFFLEQE